MKFTLFKLLSVLLICVSSSVNAQLFHHFTKANGLQGNGVYRLYQDRKGFIWLNSPNGISRFDGSSFRHFNTRNGLPRNEIWNLLPDQKDRMWFFTKSNRLGFIQNDRVISFPNPENVPFYPQQMYQSDTLTAFYSRNPSNPKYFHFENNNWSVMTAPQKKGHFIDIRRKIFYRSKDNQFTVCDSTGKDLLSIPELKENLGNEKRQLNDSIFVNVFENQILYLNTKRLSYKIYSLPQPIQTGRVTLFENQIQVSSVKQLLVFDLRFNLVKTYPTPKNVDAIFHFLDRDKNLWVATMNDGLFFYPKMNGVIRTLFPGKSIKDVLVFNHQLYVHTAQDGYFSLSSETAQPKFVMDIGKIGQMNLSHQGKGLVITNNQKIYTHLPREQKGNLKVKPTPELTVLNFHNGKWYNVGLKNLEISKDFTQVHRILNFDASQHLKATAQHLYSGGVDGLKIWQADDFVPFITQDSLHLKTITRLDLLNENNLLAGTENHGLYLINQAGTKQISDTGGETVKHIFTESKNRVWVVTSSCLFRLQSTDFWSATPKPDVFCHPFILFKDQLNAVAILDNTLFLATNKGLLSLPYNEIFNIPVSDFYLKSIAFNQEEINNNTSYLYKPENHLSVQLATLQFLPYEHVQYEYRLLPTQTEWQKIEGDNITLSGFEPGTYVAEFRQLGDIYNVLQCGFVITPRWWQSKWFYILLVVCVLASTTLIVLAVVKNHYRRKEKRLEQLRRQTEHELHALRSQMNPHFIFNSLNAIQFYLNSKGPELSEKYLIDFSKLIRMIFEYSAKKTVTIAEEMKLLHSYLELERMRFGDKLAFHLYCDSKIDPQQWKIPSLLLQPIVENAVNHGIFHSPNLGIIDIKFIKKNAQTIVITIEDNGLGVAKTQAIYKNSLNKHASKSTQILKNRIALLNQIGAFKILYEITDLSTEGKSGTSVHLEIAHFKKTKHYMK